MSSYRTSVSTANATRNDDSPVEKGRHVSRPFPLNPVYYPKKGRANARDGRGSLGGSLPAVLDRADRESRPRGTEFELWLADQVGCEHSTIIDQVSPQQLFALQRRHASGQD